MSAEEYIEAYTKRCSNEMAIYSERHYQPWLTPENALEAVRLAREEVRQQFEKNRLAACDNQTPEEAEREQEFVFGHVEKNNRIPTFNDAINYGMELQKNKDTIPAKDLEELINKLSAQFQEVSFAKLSRIAVRVSKWQKEQMMKGAIDAVVTDVVIHNNGDELKYNVCYPIGKRPFNKGDKVKLVIIKED